MEACVRETQDSSHLFLSVEGNSDIQEVTN